MPRERDAASLARLARRSTHTLDMRSATAMLMRRMVPLIGTLVLLYLILVRVPYARLVSALRDADYGLFLTLMIANAIIYVGWDTLVLRAALRWFHGPVQYKELLPVRAASYIIALANTNAARASLAIFVSRVLGQPALQIGSTVLFLVLTEFIHLVLWATMGVTVFGSEATRSLLWVPPAVAMLWLIVFACGRAGRHFETGRHDGGPAGVGYWLTAPWGSALFKTFRLAPVRRYAQIIALRSPVFFASLCLHYFGARAFGISIPFGQVVTFLPVVFIVAALPITVARVGTTQAAWLLLFGHLAPPERLLAFSLAAHLTFAFTRAVVGLVLLPLAYVDVVGGPRFPRVQSDDVSGSSVSIRDTLVAAAK